MNEGVPLAMPTTTARWSLISSTSPTRTGVDGWPGMSEGCARRPRAPDSSTMTDSGSRRSARLPWAMTAGPPMSVASSRPRRLQPTLSPFLSRTFWLPLYRDTAQSTPATPRTR